MLVAWILYLFSSLTFSRNPSLHIASSFEISWWSYKANRFPAFIFRQGCKPRLLASLMRVYVVQHLLKVTWYVNCPFWDSLLCIVHYPKWYLMRKENAWNIDIRESGVSSLYMNSHIKKKIFVSWYQNDLYWAHITVLPKLSGILRNEISSIAIVV